MTPHPRSRIRTRKQLHDLPLGRTTPKKVPCLCGNPTERRESLNLNSGFKIPGRQAIYKSNSGALIVCRKGLQNGQKYNTPPPPPEKITN